MKKQKGFKLIEIVFVILVILGIIGYTLNVFKLINSNFEQPYKREIVHFIGIIPVIGIFTGYMDIED